MYRRELYNNKGVVVLEGTYFMRSRKHFFAIRFICLSDSNASKMSHSIRSLKQNKTQ
jgi:hypothetical protein